MSRNLLHINKLDAFKDWLTQRGVAHRPTNADWQMLQVRLTPRNQPAYWAAVYRRAELKEHLSVDHRLEPLVRQFISDRRKS